MTVVIGGNWGILCRRDVYKCMWLYGWGISSFLSQAGPWSKMIKVEVLFTLLTTIEGEYYRWMNNICQNVTCTHLMTDWKGFQKWCRVIEAVQASWSGIPLRDTHKEDIHAPHRIVCQSRGGSQEAFEHGDDFHYPVAQSLFSQRSSPCLFSATDEQLIWGLNSNQYDKIENIRKFIVLIWY